jgi:predicted porin
VDNVGASGSGLNRMPNLTASFPSRLGFRVSEDLGDGLRALVTLEMGFSPDTGALSQGGRTFGRQSFVGLAGSWGAVTFGRQYTMLFWSLLDADVLGPNIYGSGSLDNTIPNARADNAFAYRGTFNGLTLGATYSLGRDVVNGGNPAATNCPGELAADAQACREWSAMVKYDSAAWGALWAIDEVSGGPGAFAGLTSSALKDRHVSVNSYVNVAAWKLTAGLVWRDNGANTLSPRSDLWYAGAVYPVTPLLLAEAEIFSLRFKQGGDKAALAAARITYSLSKRTAVYTSLGRIANDGKLALSVSSGAVGSNPVAGASQNAIALGLRHSF